MYLFVHTCKTWYIPDFQVLSSILQTVATEPERTLDPWAWRHRPLQDAQFMGAGTQTHPYD